jgi:hypothetical protein
MALAVSSRLDACDSVRRDRSALPVAISREACWITSTLVRTLPTIPPRLPVMALSEPSSCADSSRPPTALRTVRS